MQQLSYLSFLVEFIFPYELTLLELFVIIILFAICVLFPSSVYHLSVTYFTAFCNYNIICDICNFPPFSLLSVFDLLSASQEFLYSPFLVFFQKNFTSPRLDI